MAEYRNYESILKEAELIAMPPHAAADWFVKNADKTRYGVIDDVLEKNLLNLQSYNIDLALSRYGSCDEVLQEIYQRNDDILKTALLANEKILGYSFVSDWPFIPEGGEDYTWVGHLTSSQLQAMFSNKSLPDHVITQFFEKGPIWRALSERQRLTAAEYLITNIGARVPDEDDVDDFGYSSMVNAAWLFAELVDVSVPWAARLARLYSTLPPEVYLDFDPLKAAKRWHPSGDDPQQAEKEAQKDPEGFLTHFQSVRRGLARLAARSSDRKKLGRNKILGSKDLAIRCGAYLSLDLTTEEIQKACKRDGAYACRHIIQNDLIWKNGDNRWHLQRACREASRNQNNSTLQAHYNYRMEKFETDYPHWFKEQEDDDSYALGNKKVSDLSLGSVDKLMHPQSD